MRGISNRRILKSRALDLAKLALTQLMFSGSVDKLTGTEPSGGRGERLMSIAEIKETDKSTEIKYVDRIKAASLMIELARLENENNESSDSFFERFKAAADEVNEHCESGDESK